MSYDILIFGRYIYASRCNSIQLLLYNINSKFIKTRLTPFEDKMVLWITFSRSISWLHNIGVYNKELETNGTHLVPITKSIMFTLLRSCASCIRLQTNACERKMVHFYKSFFGILCPLYLWITISNWLKGKML